MQKYIYYWLLLIGLGHIALGFIFLIAAKTPLVTPYVDELYYVFNAPFDPANDQLLRTLLQLFGPTVASWGILFSLALYHYVHYGMKAVKWMIMAAVLLWFILDFGVSLVNGITDHLLLNSLAMLSILLPLSLLKVRQ